jgi:hypothetical protein
MLPENTRVKNLRTLVKFRANNENPRSRNRLITSTLGKIGFINPQYHGISPNDEEFWLVNIDSMVTRAGPVSGIFLLSPICTVDRRDISYTMPGLYTVEDADGIRLIKPHYPDGYWLMSIEDRRPLLAPDIHALIVVSDPTLVDDNPVPKTDAMPYHFSTRPIQDKSVLDEELGLSNSDFKPEH